MHEKNKCFWNRNSFNIIRYYYDYNYCECIPKFFLFNFIIHLIPCTWFINIYSQMWMLTIDTSKFLGEHVRRLIWGIWTSSRAVISWTLASIYPSSTCPSSGTFWTCQLLGKPKYYCVNALLHVVVEYS